MSQESILQIIAYGAWNGGTLVDNSIYEKKGLTFKGGIPVNRETIEQRMGVRTRVVAGTDERIGVIALQDLLDTASIDPGRIKLIIGATNVGDDKYDSGPQVRFPYELVRRHCPRALVMDLYAGCPGFNVAVELVFMLSLTGYLKAQDLSVIIGAENLHRAKAFKPDDTANIIFGDDSLATALETLASSRADGQYSVRHQNEFTIKEDPISETARKIFEIKANGKIDGIIIDNQLGSLVSRVPAAAARVQHALAELMYPQPAAEGVFRHFRDALEFYDQQIDSFAFDIMTLDKDPQRVEQIARAYVASGKYKNVVSVYLTRDSGIIAWHQGMDFTFTRPQTGIVDTITRTHGCFGDFIQALATGDDVFGDMDGKGVFLYATRGAKNILDRLFSACGIKVEDVDLIVEHQANFAMIPLTLDQILDCDPADKKKMVADLVANKLITNVHQRGNCSVVCMQRLPYDLKRGALQPDMLQGFKINANVEQLQKAKLILFDSVGAGMTRSAFLQRL